MLLTVYGQRREEKNNDGQPRFAGHEIRRRKSKGRQKFFSPNPLLFCLPERKLSKFSVRIFFEKSSDFVQDRQPT